MINGYSFSSDGTETLQSIAAKINAMSSTTGVTAQLSGSGPVTISLINNTYGSQHGIEFFDPSGILNTTATESDTGVDAVRTWSGRSRATILADPAALGRLRWLLLASEGLPPPAWITPAG